MNDFDAGQCGVDGMARNARRNSPFTLMLLKRDILEQQAFYCLGSEAWGRTKGIITFRLWLPKLPEPVFRGVCREDLRDIPLDESLRHCLFREAEQ